MGVSERRACRALGQPRSTQRYEPVAAAYEEELTAAIVELASQYGRYGYRRIGALLRRRGWAVNHKRVERIWRQEGLKAPQKQPKRSRLWLNDGSCVRLRPQRPNHVWAYDFVFTRTHDGRSVRLLTVIDEYTRECLAIRAERSIRSVDVIETLAELMLRRGVPEHIRSDNGPEFTAKAVRAWLGRVGAKTLYIEPGSPWENGYVESFNGRRPVHKTWPRDGGWLHLAGTRIPPDRETIRLSRAASWVSLSTWWTKISLARWSVP